MRKITPVCCGGKGIVATIARGHKDEIHIVTASSSGWITPVRHLANAVNCDPGMCAALNRHEAAVNAPMVPCGHLKNGTLACTGSDSHKMEIRLH
jgi:hypothetical protein